MQIGQISNSTRVVHQSFKKKIENIGLLLATVERLPWFLRKAILNMQISQFWTQQG